METTLTKEQHEQLVLARKFIEAREYKEAWKIVDKVLDADPNSATALIVATSVHDKLRNFTIAYQFARRVVELIPEQSAGWTNLGRASEQLYLLHDAEQCYMKAIELSKKPEALVHNYNNYAGLMTLTGRWALGEEAARKVLEIDPAHRKALGNLGLALLAQHKWDEGWVLYGAILGTEQRKLMKYADEVEWNGEKDKSVIVYGEQGLGDELSFASMVPDAIKDCQKVVIDCDLRLQGLFRRSFPKARVYGTRWEKDVEWKPEDTHCDASISIGQLGKIYRLKDSDFTGEPYLVPDPVRTTMWKEYFRTLKKPVIGIAWTGGMPWTAARFRKWALKELEPMIRSVDAHWVSLQYKDCEEEIAASGLPIHQYSYATLTKDYDDTAALVAACDLVICMQTSVGHLAGALGKEAWVFVNKLSQWRYAGEGDDIIWYKSVKLFRAAEDGSWPIEKATQLLQLRYGNRELRRELTRELRRA